MDSSRKTAPRPGKMASISPAEAPSMFSVTYEARIRVPATAHCPDTLPGTRSTSRQSFQSMSVMVHLSLYLAGNLLTGERFRKILCRRYLSNWRNEQRGGDPKSMARARNRGAYPSQVSRANKLTECAKPFAMRKELKLCIVLHRIRNAVIAHTNLFGCVDTR